MQRLAVPQQVALDLGVTASPQVSALIGQIGLHNGAQGLGRAHPAFDLFAGRITAQTDPGVQSRWPSRVRAPATVRPHCRA